MKELIKFSVISGYRSNSFRLLMFMLLGCLVLAWLGSSFSARSPQTLLLDLGLSLLRIVLTLMAVFWVQELYYKDLEKKTAIFLFSYPASRAKYLAARFLGVLVLISMAVVVSAILLLLTSAVSGIDYQQAWSVNLGVGYGITWVYFWLDIAVVMAFAFMLCSYSETPNLPVTCALGFAVAMHAMGPVLDYLRYSNSADDTQVMYILPFVEKAMLVLPDLNRLDIRAWTLYGEIPSIDLLLWAAFSAVAYVALFFTASVVGLNKREIL